MMFAMTAAADDRVHLLSPAGFQAGVAACGIKASGRPDVALLVADAPVACAAAFTTNKMAAAPIVVGREHAAAGRLRAIVVNSGNANAATGPRGVADARRMCRLAADAVGCLEEQVLPSSTGVIGRMLPMDKLAAGIADAAANLGDSAEHAAAFAGAILTTDAGPKTAATTFKLGRETVTLAGVCKGAGMIGPDLVVAKSRPKQATMLAYFTTDAATTPASLRKLLGPAVGRTFNRTSVDGHTSTSDTAVLLASGRGARIGSTGDAATFLAALTDVAGDLARQIARDGEGATKLVTIRVTGAASERDADAIARTIGASPLVKTAIHGGDPNWGRVVSAAGYAPAKFDPDAATLKIQGKAVFRRGRPAKYDAATVSAAMRDAEDVTLHLECGLGEAAAEHWTCDLSREYIRINADYTT